MKTNRVILLLLALLSVTLVQNAQALYNPSSGRWLSRDPIGDEAFFTSYAAGKITREQNWIRERTLDQAYIFNHNSPIGTYDIDGAIIPFPPLPGFPPWPPFLPKPIIVSLGLPGPYSKSECALYYCGFTHWSSRRAPEHPFLFASCLETGIADFVSTALAGNGAGNKAACKFVQNCYKLYWN